ncbi:hypothetical protein DXU84_22165 [Rahnella sp. RcJ3]|nr:hypothetical protein [Rahnella sp. RcJ3]
MWLMKTLLTSWCINQRGAGQLFCSYKCNYQIGLTFTNKTFYLMFQLNTHINRGCHELHSRSCKNEKKRKFKG